MDLLPVLVPVVGVLATAITGLITVYVARKKGLPDLNREIESRMGVLVKTLQDQLDAAQEQYKELASDFNDCKSNLEEALTDNKRLYRRLRLAEGDLRDLYGAAGKDIPRHLINPENNHAE